MWRPILTGHHATRAVELAIRIAGRIEALDRQGCPPDLSRGAAGFALLFHYLGRVVPSRAFHETSRSFLEVALRAIEHGRLSPSLFDGLAGVCFAAQQLVPEQELLDDADAALASLVSDWPERRPYDLISGLVGLGVYFRERTPRRRAVESLGLVVDRLSERARPLAGGASWRSGPLHPELTTALAADDPRRQPAWFDLGQAHGVAGVVSFLARAHRQLPDPRLARLSEQALSWLDAHRSREGGADGGGAFPSMLHVEGRPYGFGDSTNWCYGNLAVELAFFAAGEAFDREDWRHRPFVSLSRLIHPAVDLIDGADMSLCHGRMGFAHIANRCVQRGGHEALTDHVRALFVKATQFLETRLADGFRVFREETTQKSTTKPGFLEGEVGVALALLAAASDVEPAWDRLMLLS